MEILFDQIIMYGDTVLWINYINLWDEDPDWVPEASDISDVPINEILNIQSYINENNI